MSKLQDLLNNRDYKESIHELADKVVLPPIPNPSMVAFEKGLQEGECFEDYRLMASNGWLSPSGVLYACRWGSHGKVTHFFNAKLNVELHRQGFIRLSQMRFHLYDITQSMLNSEQIRTIQKWHAVNNLDTELFDKDYDRFTR